VLSVIHSRLLTPPERPLVELTGQLTAMVVLPYLGPAAAEREIARPAPSPLPPPPSVDAAPLREANMRLTQRTVLVITAIGELGGRGTHPSNRQVGRPAGIVDQGQRSKLLSRLERIGLIENDGDGHARGAANAWALTEAGRRVHSVVEASERERKA
jgi:hypothetical protein